MSGSSPAKAIIKSTEAGVTLECLFNPKEYQFAKANSWPADQKTGYNLPQLNFGGGQPATLQMELFFDTYAETRQGGAPRDVRKVYTDQLWKLMRVNAKLKDKKIKRGRPPTVLFIWGNAWSFEAVITSLQLKFTLFHSDGTPVRATANVTFQEIKDKEQLAAQNPTSGGIGGERMWTVTDGDTLAWIAYKEFGDATQWRRIAEANRLSGVRDLAPGTVLVIPNG
jgi:hypothetical protein